jgi:GDP-4-dehydro-6-deoxy-D-mannose reductase
MNTRRIVITGINGFVGHHLARELASHNIAVTGVGREKKPSSELQDLLTEYHAVDLIREWPSIKNADAVIHLAGLAAVGPSFDSPQRYINANSSMITNICEYFLQQNERPRLLIVSSGAVYNPDQVMPITEESDIGFTSPYAVSKILAENQCAYYRNRGLDCIIARPFNHIGPGQGKGFILPDFYERLSELDDGVASIKVGSINTRRDYTDVRDIVSAYVKLILAPSLEHTLYNVCSGRSLSGEDILNKLKHALGKDDVQFEIDRSLVRPTDVIDIYGDSSRLRKEFDWEPTHSIDDTIADFVADARRKNRP